jgi:glutaminyl-tRNA synthetase
MPTLAGLRRRGVPPAALRDFAKRVGVAKANSIVDAAMLDFSIREELNRSALRRMGVLRPLKVVVDNYPQGTTEELDAVNNPEDPSAGARRVSFSREIFRPFKACFALHTFLMPTHPNLLAATSV